jgi:2-oxoglutarate ferredoxin oxidoreductase subunit gamma
MSQKALDLYLSGAKKGSVVIADPDLVNTDTIEGYEVVKVHAMKTADDMGMRLVSNMIMLGAFVKKSGLFPIEVLEKTLRAFVSEKYLQADIDAVRAGANLV